MAVTTSDPKGPGHAAAELFWQVLQQDSVAGAGGPPPLTSPAISRQDVGHLNRLAHAAQTIAKLKDTSWWHQPEPSWQDTLGPMAMGAVYTRIARHASTGVLHVHNQAGDERFMAFVAGQPMGAASPHRNDSLGNYLLERGILGESAAEEALAFVAGTDRNVGWAILALQLVTPERLFRAQQEQTHAIIQQTLWWTDGVADFYDNSAVVDLRRVVDLNLAQVLRDAVTTLYLQDVGTLKTLTAPLFARKEPLQYDGLPDSMAALLDHVDAAITDTARHQQLPELLLRAVSGRPPPDLARLLADVYVLTLFGCLHFRAHPHHVCLPTPPMRPLPKLSPTPVQVTVAASGSAPTVAKAGSTPKTPAAVPQPAPEAPLDPLAAYQALKEVLAQTKRALYAFEPDKATNLIASYLRRVPEPPADVVAYYSLALFLQGDMVRANEQALRAMKINNQDALAHAALARVLESSANSNGAYHRKYALTLAQNNPAWHNEVYAALTLSAKPAKKDKDEAENSRTPYLWMLAAVTLGALFACTTVWHLGDKEYYYTLTDPFFFIRRGVLLAVGAVGLLIYQGKLPLRALRDMPWRISNNMVIGTVLWGLIVGLLSPTQLVKGTWDVVLGLTFFHVLAEEMFFRGFLTRMLLDELQGSQLALLLSAIIFGLYHATYATFWYDLGIQPRMYYMGLIALFAGYPYAWFMRASKTVVAPFLCHLTINGVMMLHSLVHRDGLPF